MIGEDLSTIPRLWTAIAQWLACMVYILPLKNRLIGRRFVTLVGGALLALCICQWIAGLLPLWLWVPGMASSVVLMYFFIYLSAVDKMEAGAICAIAFITSELTASFAWQISYFVAGYIVENEDIFSLFFINLIILVTYIILYGICFLIQRRDNTKLRKMRTDAKDLLIIVFIAIFVFFFSNFSFITTATPFSGKTLSEIFFIRTLVDFAGLVIFFAMREHKHWIVEQNEVSAMENVLKKHYEQYMASKERIDAINLKYHDLKHQLAIIRKEENPEKKNKYLDAIEADIKKYEAENKTGNAVLDTVLNTKGMLCLAQNISFTCVCQGQLLEFMDVMDICSLFGNAIDNSIESASSIADKDKRLVKTSLFKQNNFLIIRFENYFENELKYEAESLVSTKSDKLLHGFGIRSIENVAEKYGGSVNISAENNWFTLCVLIPM
jgi:hypothetical protein